MTCRLCYSRNLVDYYRGPIRSGGVGSGEINGFAVKKCCDCNFVFLDPVPEGLDLFYESDEYRSRFDYTFDPEAIHNKYAHEQTARLYRIRVEHIRGRSLLDLGASAGVFLDVVRGYASRTVAVEPFTMYHEYLCSQGHDVFSYPQDAIESSVKVDIVTCFDVIEHIENPRDFISSAFKLLKPGGVFFLSMPNLDDLLLTIAPNKFKPFFFQVAHLNYFSSGVIPLLFEGSGFKINSVDYIHKYGLDNLIRWVSESSTAPAAISGLFERTFLDHYKAEVERLGIASHLFIVATKDKDISPASS